jgi:hypothetical protein
VGPPDRAKIISRVEAKSGLSQENKPLVTFTLPPPHILKPGEYSVYVSVGTRTGNPAIALPLPEDDGHRRYRLGSIKISPPN